MKYYDKFQKYDSGISTPNFSKNSFEEICIKILLKTYEVA